MVIYPRVIFRFPLIPQQAWYLQNFFSILQEHLLFITISWTDMGKDQLFHICILCDLCRFFWGWMFCLKSPVLKILAKRAVMDQQSAPALSFSMFLHGLVSPEYTIFLPGSALANNLRRQDRSSIYRDRSPFWSFEKSRPTGTQVQWLFPVNRPIRLFLLKHIAQLGMPCFRPDSLYEIISFINNIPIIHSCAFTQIQACNNQAGQEDPRIVLSI